jgi:hypothetical protein
MKDEAIEVEIALVAARIPYWRAANLLTVFICHQDRTMLTAQLRPGGIQFVGKTVRRVGRQDVIGQIETITVHDRVLSNQVEMVARHA